MFTYHRNLPFNFVSFLVLDDWRIINGVLREIWFNVPSSSLDKLRADKTFPNYPDIVNNLNIDLDAPNDFDDNYGQRLTAYIQVNVSI